MHEPNPRARFEALARLPDARIDLAESSLLVAAEEYPTLEFADYLERLQLLAGEAEPFLRGAVGAAERVERLNRFLFVEQAFAGNRARYDDPRNSFLNQVLDRRTGIPITLSIVYLEVARRLGLDAHGVSFPGHFLVKVVGEEEIIVDAFFGGALSHAQCEQRLRALAGPSVALRPEVHLRAATNREILVRLLTNLKVLYIRTRDFGRALSCCERILVLVPDSPLELRDRGFVYDRLECSLAAASDFRRFLKLAPDDESADTVRRRLVALSATPRQLH